MREVNLLIWAIVPCKHLASVNSRLMAVLSAAERRQLACAMLSDVLGALVDTPRLAGVLVASEDPTVKNIAISFGARCLDDFIDTGLSPALTRSSRLLAGEGAHGVIAIHADLPLLTSADITAVIGNIVHDPAVAIAPAETDLGTNVLAMSPPGVVAYAFGEKSSLRHASAAKARSIEPTIIASPTMGFDLDTPADLSRFAATPSDTRTYGYLAESGIRERLAGQRTDRMQNANMG